MILTGDNKTTIVRIDLTGPRVFVKALTGISGQPENPPSYEDAARDHASPAIADSKLSDRSPQLSSETLHALPPPTNFVRIYKRDGKIEGTWTIDPTLAVPESLLAPLPKGDVRRTNLHLEAQNGPVNAEVHLVTGAGPLPPNVASFVALNRSGHTKFVVVRVKLLCP